MKNNIVYLMIGMITVLVAPVRAQIDPPNYSPETTLHTRIGYTDLTVRYGQPSARGRKIMDGLVPYNRLWRTGAGNATQIKFSTLLY